MPLRKFVTEARLRPRAALQGGKLQIGAPHGNWQMVVIYRGKHDPVRMHCAPLACLGTQSPGA